MIRPHQRKLKNGWKLQHPKYGVWFISRASVAKDWKKDQAQAYPDQKPREPIDQEIDTWFDEQISWCEVAAYGKQLKRPDMDAWEKEWLIKMRSDATEAWLVED